MDDFDQSDAPWADDDGWWHQQDLEQQQFEEQHMNNASLAEQELADEFWWGDVWREFCQNRTLETAQKASRAIYLSLVAVASDVDKYDGPTPEERELMDELESMYSKTYKAINKFKREQNNAV